MPNECAFHGLRLRTKVNGMFSLKWMLLLGVLGFALASRPAHAEVQLHGMFSDHMVLQQNRPVPVWGSADSGESVTIRFRGQTVETQAGEDGKWQVVLDPLQAGGPDPLLVEGENRLELENVLVGEVWICSGQSNMEWPLKRAFEGETAIAESENAQLRLYHVPRLKSQEPVDDVDASWKPCNPDTTPDFSAVGYYFGQALQKALDVPVGLIDSSWGGSPAEVWMRREMLEANPRYQREILDSYRQQIEQYEEAIARYKAEEAEHKKQGETFDQKPPRKPYWQPSELYNGMIAPLIPYAIAGAIWYQGESNAGRPDQYRTLFPDMIRNWRFDWRQGSFPFLAVQLAPWDKNRNRSLEEITAEPSQQSDWAELREAQVLATQVLPQTGLAVITDVGEKDDIHPRKKSPVGQRLALSARGIHYEQPIVYSGPRFKRMEIQGDRAILHFDHVGDGLVVEGDELKGFAVAGQDREFVWAEASIEGDRVIVHSSEVPHPAAVRYGWADYPVVNLFNQAGLPASPFRTDDF